MTAPEHKAIHLNSKGFTLLEVIVAMAVLSIVMVTLFRLQASTVGLSGAVAFNQVAPRLAKEQVHALIENNFNPDDLDQELEAPYTGYTWACDIREAGEDQDWDSILPSRQLKRLKQIKITILSPDRNSTFSLSTWTYDNSIPK